MVTIADSVQNSVLKSELKWIQIIYLIQNPVELELVHHLVSHLVQKWEVEISPTW